MDKQINTVQIIVDKMLANGEPMRVLEAGCGSRSFIQFGPRAYIAGIDISKEQLQKNTLLQEKILGDIQTYPLSPATFDVVICWDVLEHLPQPENALKNFLLAVRPGGIIVLGAPVMSSLKGLVTKFTPHWFHVLLYRKLIGNPLAGTPGNGPFKTFLKSSMSPRSIRQFAGINHLDIDFFETFEGVMQQNVRKRYRLADILFRVVSPLVKLLSFGAVDPDATEFVAVLRKPGADRHTSESAAGYAVSTQPINTPPVRARGKDKAEVGA